MIQGHKIDLRIVERDELSTIYAWGNDPEFMGKYEPINQMTRDRLEKQYDEKKQDEWFFILNKEDEMIGAIYAMPRNGYQVIGYALVKEMRGNGYGTEAVWMIVDYLFLSKNIVRVQAETHPDNVASHRVLEKSGFQKEGIIRCSFFSRGVFRDTVLFSILREEWKGPFYNW